MSVEKNKTKKGEKITINVLARMMQDGFTELRDGLRAEMRAGFKESEERDTILAKRIDGVAADVHDIKLTVKSLVQSDREQDSEIKDFKICVTNVERKVGV